MNFPARPSRGSEILTWAQQAWEYMRSLSLRAGPGIEIVRSSNGTIISAQTGKGGAANASHPFKITNASNPTNGCRVTVAKGMVETSYGAGPYPSNLWPTPDAPLYLTVNADVMWVRLVSTITTGETPAISSMALDITASLANDTATVAYVIIGKVESEVVEGTRRITSIFNNVRDNLAHSLAFEGYSYPDYWRQLIGPVS